MSAFDINIAGADTLRAEPGESLLQALMRNEKYLTASCGGKGTCGNCKVRLLEGEAEVKSRAKLTKAERESGLVLACRTYPRGDLSIEIPEGSRLVVGGRVAVEHAMDLAGHLGGAGLSPLVETLDLKLPAPTLEDSISDLERIKRELDGTAHALLDFSAEFARAMGQVLRSAGWEATLGHAEGRAVFLCSHECNRRYGVAVDIGTTTVVVYLVDVQDGSVVDVGSTYNAQMRYGDDVITRIVHATEGGGLKSLQDAIVRDINDIIGVLASRHGIDRGDIDSAAIAGNTTMTQLFWGIDPGPIREEPYIPSVNVYPAWQALGSGLDINPAGPVYTAPCVASYVGGDVVAGVLASMMHRKDELALFMDVGTNGEIVLGNNEFLVTAACSAGPCFEGSGIRHGMRATEGAIEKVSIDPKTLAPSISAIDDVAPRGVCGSGMIEAISEMFLTGVIDQRGKFTSSVDTDWVHAGEEGAEYVLHRDKDRLITLTEVDIENILRAKAAIYAGISLLVREIGFSVSDIQKVYIAGGFGRYIDVRRGIILGMLPDIPEERFEFLGNTSIAGAYLALLSGDMRAEAERVASMMTYFELSVSASFMDEYMSAMFLPHTDLGNFPSVAKVIKAK